MVEPARIFDETILELPLLELMPEGVRSLVADSFEPVSFSFGTAIVREGEDADSFYVVRSGTARVLKAGHGGDEIPLNVLQPGDSFGEMALLEKSTRLATVRASSEVSALRLDRGVFQALTRRHPEVRDHFVQLARQRTVWNFIRLHTVFAALPNEGLALLARELEPVEVAENELVIAEGDPAGPMYLVESGRLRAFQQRDGAREDLSYLRTGDFFGEASLFKGSDRTASVEAVTPAKLLRLTPELFHRLAAEYPEFRERVEERVTQYDYARVARVPLDFAEEILPAEAGAAEKVAPEQAELVGQDGAASFEAAEHSEPSPRRRRRFRFRRFSHVYQLDEMDCGAACLAMICREFGKSVGLPAIRELVYTARDGTSLVGIARGAEALGLAARTVRASKSNLAELPTPAIVHWEGNHWVVLYEVSDGHVRVADPATGLKKIDRDEFAEKWSGYAALLTYTPAFEAAPEATSNYSWLLPFARPFRRTIVKALLLALLAAALQMIIPIFTQIVVDHAIPHGNRGLLLAVLVALLAVLGVMIGATIIQRYILSRVAVEMDVSTLDFLTGRLLALPMSYFNTRRTGDIERRLAGIRTVRQFLVQSGVQALTAVTQLLAALILMFVYSWILALVYLATVPLYVGLMRFSSTRLKPMFDSLEEAYGKYSSQQIDAIKGIETVKAMSAEEGLRRLMLERFSSLAQRLFRAEFLIMSYQGAIQMVTFLSLALFLFVGALQVMNGSISLGVFVSFNALVVLANGPILIVLSLWDQVQYSRILLDRLNDVLEHEPEQGGDHSGLTEVRTLEGRLKLANVGFRYGGPDSPSVVEGIDFDVRPGTSVAIVGRSGSGKTTLIKLLSGLLEPTDGVILYDGIDMTTLDYRTLRKHIGFVLQENHLFEDTIARNIAFGEEQVDGDRVLWAAKVANAHEFVERLPLGYETKVGESGLRLSGGQKQRIAIARAVYNQPPVLLFDEATSSLDTESERAVKENMDELLEGRTSFVIAHRLSTIRDADVILVLERGKLVEQGTHDELLARQGLYYYLSSQQLEL